MPRDDDVSRSQDVDPIDDALIALMAAGVDEHTDQETMSGMVIELASEQAIHMLEQLRHDAERAVRQNRRFERGFQKRLRDPWGPAIDKLEALALGCIDAGERFNERFRPRAAAEQNFRFESVIRLHARAVLIAREVLTLLKAGLADGAHSRWRTLHEVTVIASFIAGGDNELGERYLLHYLITRWRSLADHQMYAARLNQAPFAAEEAADLQRAHDQLVERYGKSYENEWGWAAEALGVSSPTFRQIEQKTELDHWRPYFRMASHAIHAGSQGIRFKLGVLDDMPLAGPSNVGLADPGSGTALSLNIATATLMTLYPDLESLAVARTLGMFAIEVSDAFGEAHQVLQHRIDAERGAHPQRTS